MESLISRIRALVAAGNVQVSEHGYDELANDDIVVRDVVEAFAKATVIREYPDYYKGACVLVREYDSNGNPIHVVWGVPKGQSEPAVLVTAYRPDPGTWDEEFLRRRR